MPAIKSIDYKKLIPKEYRRARVGELLDIGTYSLIDAGEFITRHHGEGLRLPTGYEHQIYLIKKIRQ